MSPTEDCQAFELEIEAHVHAEPFFIVGYSRSGTTLLQALIDAHPNVTIPPESHIYDRFGPVFGSYGDLRLRRNRLRFMRALLSDVFIRQWRLDATAEDVERRLQRPDRVGIIDALFSLYAQRNGAIHWGDKTPEHMSHVRQIKADFPEAKLIHLVRDGRDVAEAMRRMVFGPVSAIGLARHWRSEVLHWQNFCEQHGNADTLLIRYEDLVRQPRAVVARVFEFIGEPYVDTVSTYASTSLSRTLGSTQSWHGSLRQGISTSKIGIYRRKLSARYVETFESIAGAALRAYGYELDYAHPRAASLHQRLMAPVADRVVRWYRKLFHPTLVWLELQFRLRLAHRWLSLLMADEALPVRPANRAQR